MGTRNNIKNGSTYNERCQNLDYSDDVVGIETAAHKRLTDKKLRKKPERKEIALQLLAPPFFEMAFCLPGLDGKNEGDEEGDGDPAPADAYQARP